MHHHVVTGLLAHLAPRRRERAFARLELALRQHPGPVLAQPHHQIGDLDQYLASLDMEIVFQPFDEIGRARISQLIMKSNQYNLTTRRYSEADVKHLSETPDCFTLQVRLIDAFGDNGMISVVICRTVAEAEWEVDTWLMSCRVLGRKVEHMVLRELLAHARQHRIQRLPFQPGAWPAGTI